MTIEQTLPDIMQLWKESHGDSAVKVAVIDGFAALLAVLYAGVFAPYLEHVELDNGRSRSAAG